MLDEHSGDDPEPFGARLRGLREARGLSRDDVAQATNIPADKIDAIEAGTITGTTPPAYARGFVKIYAEHVEADVDAIMGAFDRHCRLRPAKLYLQGLGPMVHKDYRPGRHHGRQRAVVRAVLLSLLGLCLIIGAYYVYKNFDALLGLSEKAPADTEPTSSSPASSELTQSAEVSETPAVIDEPRYELLIVADENAWIRAEQDGTLVKTWEVLGKGERFAAIGTRNVAVTLRNPSLVRVYVEGELLTEELGTGPVTIVRDADGTSIFPEAKQ
jgi:cytoskeletal protein RodZ